MAADVKEITHSMRQLATAAGLGPGMVAPVYAHGALMGCWPVAIGEGASGALTRRTSGL